MIEPMTGLNRTEEWHRLVRTGYFHITDLPGEITVANKGGIHSLPWKIWLPGYVGATLLVLALLNLNTLAALFMALFGIALLARSGPVFAIEAWKLFHGRAAKAVFTPEGVVFYGRGGRQVNALRRESLQQIALEEVESKRVQGFCHTFVADTGWMKAFPAHVGKHEATIRNNLLMAAFAQPLELDLYADVEGSPYIETLLIVDGAPQITGLTQAVQN